MMRMGLVALLLAGTAMPALAAEIAVSAPIEAVTVYPSGAAVTRGVPFAVPEGSSVLLVADLPNGIDVGSLRIDGAADAGLEIRTVDARSAKEDVADDPERNRIEAAIDDIRAGLAGIEDELNVLRAQRLFLDNLIAEGPRGFADAIGNSAGGIAEWSAALRAIGTGLSEVVDGIRDATVRQRGLNEQLIGLQAELSALPQPRSVTELRIEVSAAAAATGELGITYQVNAAGWSPAYEAHLDTGSETESPGVEIIRRAEISQSTGEDWTDVAVTLSTTRPTGGTQAPELSSSFVRIWDGYYYAADGIGRLAGGAPSSAAEAAQPAPPPMPIGQMQAVADFGDFKADFIVPVPVTVESGVGVRRVRLATDTAEAELYVEAVPRISEQAFLTAAFTLESEAPILSGNATLFRDGAFIGNGYLPFTQPGEEISVGFGADDQVRVTWSVVARESGVGGFLTRVNTEEYHYQLTVENAHSRAIDIAVLDRIPVSEDERITVNRLPLTTEPTEEDVDGNRGVLAWTYEYAPGESRTIDLAYIVTWPGDQSVTGAE